MKKPKNFVLVIFGASGDLTKRKLAPSLFNIYAKNLMPDDFRILGVGRTKLDDDSFRDIVSKGIYKFARHDCISKDKIDRFVSKFFYLSHRYFLYV